MKRATIFIDNDGIKQVKLITGETMRHETWIYYKRPNTHKEYIKRMFAPGTFLGRFGKNVGLQLKEYAR